MFWQRLATAALVIALMMTMTKHASAFSAAFSWVGVPACEKISPAFRLSGVPAATKQLRFAMVDLDVPTFRHGGSTISYGGENVGQGAISYIGPCPPAGQRHHYRWTIEALDASGKVLGTATATDIFPPK
jgi:phosphatidylethanolamine-binding protein (PEBP) family uncharacterized protein